MDSMKTLLELFHFDRAARRGFREIGRKEIGIFDLLQL